LFVLDAAAPTAAAAKKEMSPQQQKMKHCAAKWGEEKTTKKVSGRKAHNEFMSACLKGLTQLLPAGTNKPPRGARGLCIPGVRPEDRGRRRKTEIV
jgi:hypothetical protein